MEDRICAFHGCEAPARARYCCDAHGNAARQAKARERRVVARIVLTIDAIAAPERFERIAREPRAFGVPTTPEVAYIFRDDDERFRHSGVRAFHAERIA